MHEMSRVADDRKEKFWNLYSGKQQGELACCLEVVFEILDARLQATLSFLGSNVATGFEKKTQKKRKRGRRRRTRVEVGELGLDSKGDSCRFSGMSSRFLGLRKIKENIFPRVKFLSNPKQRQVCLGGDSK